MLQFKLDSVRVLWHCFHKIIQFFVWSTQESRRKRILWCSFSFVFFITFYFFDTIPLKLYRFSLFLSLSTSLSLILFSHFLSVSQLSALSLSFVWHSMSLLYFKAISGKTSQLKGEISGTFGRDRFEIFSFGFQFRK